MEIRLRNSIDEWKLVDVSQYMRTFHTDTQRKPGGGRERRSEHPDEAHDDGELVPGDLMGAPMLDRS